MDNKKTQVFIERAAPLTKEGIRAVCGTEKEYKIYMKKLMTRVAKGEISMEQANELIKPKIMQNQRAKTSVGTPEKHTQQRKTKSLGGQK